MTNVKFLDRLRSCIARSFNSNIGRETFGSMGLKFTSIGLVFLSSVILARILGPADYGIYAYVYALVSLLSVPSEFGLPTLVVRETASGMARQDYAAIQGVWRWSGRMTAIISLSLVALAGLGIWFFKEPMTGTRLETFAWALILVPLIALGNLRGAALRGLKRIVSGQMPEFLLRPGIFVLLLCGDYLWSTQLVTAPIAMAFYVIASALAFVIGALLLWRATPELVRQATPHVENRTWLLSALPLAFIGGMSLINQQASILLQGFFLPDAEIGIFRVATQVSMLASFSLMAINTVIAPRFAGLYAQGNKVKLQGLVTASARFILVSNVVITIGFVLLGKVFLRQVFGISYEKAYIPLLILLVGQLVNSGVGSVAMLLNMTHHEKETAKGMTLAAVLNVALNLLLLPRWGINGSAFATVVSMIVWNIVLWWLVRKKLHINSLAFYCKGNSF